MACFKEVYYEDPDETKCKKDSPKESFREEIEDNYPSEKIPPKETSEERWQATRSTVLERNKYMFNNPVMSDIKFAFPNKQTIPAHKYVLAISSPVFFAMFYGDLAERRETVDITDCEPAVFLQFLRYLYYDDANFRDVNSAIQVWCAADKYDVPSLANECMKFIDASMDPLNAFDVIPYARLFNHQDLEEVCWEVIDYNTQEIVAADSFLEVKHEFLLAFLMRSSLSIDEVTLFKAVDRWAAKRCEEANMIVDGEKKRSVLGEDLLKHIRFSLMSPQKFSDVVLRTEILSQSEVIDVFKQFTSVSVPGGIKFSKLPRIENSVPLLSCPMGSTYSKFGAIYYTPLPFYIPEMPKAGMLTFTVRKAITLCGVKIITEMVQSRPFCRVYSLSVAQRGQKIKQIKDKFFITKNGPSGAHGQIVVFFNRRFRLAENTCYTIETETDTTVNHNFFVWSKSLQESSRKSNSNPSKSSILSGHCSGHYTECIPAHVHYKGEIMELLYKE